MADTQSDEETCSICFDEYTDNNKELELECKHKIHANCCKLLKSDMCPICRHVSDSIKSHRMTNLQILNHVAELCSTIVNDFDRDMDMTKTFNSIKSFYCDELTIINKLVDKTCQIMIYEIRNHNSMLESMILCAENGDIVDPGFITVLIDILRNIMDKINFFKLQLEYGDVQYNNDSSDSEDELVDDSSDQEEQPVINPPATPLLPPIEELTIEAEQEESVIPEVEDNSESDESESEDSDPEKITEVQFLF